MVSTLGVAVVELAFGLCLGAMEVSVGPMASVILQQKNTFHSKYWDYFSFTLGSIKHLFQQLHFNY